MSSSGLYLKLPEPVKLQTNLRVVIWLSDEGRMAVDGEVVRVEPLADNRVGVAIRITSHRLL